MAEAQKAEDRDDSVEEKDEPAKPAKPQVKEDEDGNVVVALPEKDEPRKTRRERREEHREERQSHQELLALRQQVAALHAEVQRRQQPAYQQPPQHEDPYEAEISRIRTQQETIQTALRTGAVQDAAEVERLRRSFYDLDGNAKRIERERIKREVLEEVSQRNSNRAGDYEEATLRNEYPDVVSHPSAMRWAMGQYYQLIAEGHPQTVITSRRAMQMSAEKYGLRQPAIPAPTAAQQARYGGVSGQASMRASNEIRLDGNQKKMAMARWPQDDEHVAYAKMAALLRNADSSTD